jgi:hypothetical protein
METLVPVVKDIEIFIASAMNRVDLGSKCQKQYWGVAH